VVRFELPRTRKVQEKGGKVRNQSAFDPVSTRNVPKEDIMFPSPRA